MARWARVAEIWCNYNPAVFRCSLVAFLIFQMTLNESQDHRLPRSLQTAAIPMRSDTERRSQVTRLSHLSCWIWSDRIPFDLHNGVCEFHISLPEITHIYLDHLLEISTSQATKLKLPLLSHFRVFAINRDEFGQRRRCHLSVGCEGVKTVSIFDILIYLWNSLLYLLRHI